MKNLGAFSRVFPLSVLFLGALLSLTGCDGKSAQEAKAAPQTPPQAVDVYTVKTQPFKLSETYAGRVSAYRTAEIRPQVNGIILKRFFVEGATVKAGDQLYQIDPAPYRAELNQASSELAVAEANAESVRLKAKRYRELLTTNAISQQDADDAEAAWKQAKAQIQVARAAVQSAKINLDYTRITAPISGVISRSNVTEGALVSAQQATALATVRQLSPVYVDIQQPAAAVLRMRRQGDLTDHEVHLKLEDGTRHNETGKLQFSEAHVDPGTGTVNVRAVFENKERLLMPGMFVRADVVIERFKQAILVPQQGVSINPNGLTNTMLVGAENKIESREIKVLKAVDDKWLVSEGLQEGDRVVIKGLQKIKVGAVVNPSDPAAAKAPEAK
ncbi:MAG: efflux RND transporter periplasmic adaptor subunit [Candidatus Thiodiazotropha sp.]